MGKRSFHSRPPILDPFHLSATELYRDTACTSPESRIKFFRAQYYFSHTHQIPTAIVKFGVYSFDKINYLDRIKITIKIRLKLLSDSYQLAQILHPLLVTDQRVTIVQFITKRYLQKIYFKLRSY